MEVLSWKLEELIVNLLKLKRSLNKHEARLQEVGLNNFPSELLPTEEALIKFESLSKSARDKGRKFVGSSEGEDLQLHFRPTWTRTPSIDVLVGDGTLEDRIKGAFAARKARAEKERVDFAGTLKQAYNKLKQA